MLKMNINDIINEEIKKHLNESYSFEPEHFKFKQQITNPSFYNYSSFSSDHDVEIYESDIIVEWHIGFWLNEMGVENFMVHIDRVSGDYKIELINKQSDATEQEIVKNIEEIKWNFNIDDATLDLNGGLYIQSISFDFNTKSCDIDF